MFVNLPCCALVLLLSHTLTAAVNPPVRPRLTVVMDTGAVAAVPIALTPDLITAYLGVKQALAAYWPAHKDLFRVAQQTAQHRTVSLSDGTTLHVSVFDYPRLVRTDTALAAIFNKHHLDPMQFAAIQAAAMQGVGEAGRTTLDPASALGQNVTLVRAHLEELVAVGVDGGDKPSVDSTPASVDITPDTLAFDDTTRATTFTMSNSGARAMEVWLALDCGGNRKVVEPVDALEASWQNTYPCAVSWLSGFPQHVALAPHERRTIPMQVIPYPTLHDGYYVARLIYAQTPIVIFGARAVGHDEIAITYHKGPPQPRPARTQWSALGRVGQASPPVSHLPDVLVLDDRTPATTFTLRNPGPTPTEVWIALDCPWLRGDSSDIYVDHTTRQSQYEFAWHQQVPNAVLWLSGYPQHLVLAPHERRTIPLKAIPYGGLGLMAGSYYARVVYVQSPVLTVTAAGDTTYTTPHGAIPVVYHAGALPLRLALHELHLTPYPEGRSQACVTVQQPGIGVVAVLHAEVDDAMGYPVRPRAAAGGSPPPGWGVDTTVEVWLTAHDSDLVYRKDPAPVCVTLPVFARGHYHLVVSASPLEDRARHQPVQATVPLEVP